MRVGGFVTGRYSDRACGFVVHVDWALSSWLKYKYCFHILCLIA